MIRLARRSTSALAGGALVLVAVLTGCSGEREEAPPEPPPAATPSGDPEPEAEAAPVPPPAFLDVVCADLLGEERLAEVFSSELAEQAPSWVELSSETGPARYVLRHLGGIECEWGVGRPWEAPPATNEGFVGVNVRVLPRATEAWNAVAQYYGTGGTETSSCQALEAVDECVFDVLDGDRWIKVTALGVPAGAADRARPLLDDVLAAVRAATPTTARWTPPEDALPLGPDCAQFFTPEEAGDLLELPEVPTLDATDGGASLSSETRRAASSAFCPWAAGSGNPSAASSLFHTWLPAGEWAWEEERGRASDEYSPIEVPGLVDDDAAFLRCPDPVGACSVDVIVGGNWLRFGAAQDEYVEVPIADKPVALTALGELAVATLRG